MTASSKRAFSVDPIRGDSHELRILLDQLEERLSRIEGRTGNPDFHGSRLKNAKLEKLTSDTGKVLVLTEDQFNQVLAGTLGDLVIQPDSGKVSINSQYRLPATKGTEFQSLSIGELAPDDTTWRTINNPETYRTGAPTPDGKVSIIIDGIVYSLSAQKIGPVMRYEDGTIMRYEDGTPMAYEGDL